MNGRAPNLPNTGSHVEVTRKRQPNWARDRREERAISSPTTKMRMGMLKAKRKVRDLKIPSPQFGILSSIRRSGIRKGVRRQARLPSGALGLMMILPITGIPTEARSEERRVGKE